MSFRDHGKSDSLLESGIWKYELEVVYGSEVLSSELVRLT
jgi:hypothetical protein